MKKLLIVCIAIILVLAACGTDHIQKPEICALCDNLPCHAPCIINLSTGEKLELSVYEPHPFTVGELAEVQRGGYFSFIRGAGVKGHKLGGESITITTPMKSEALNLQHFCSICRNLLADFTSQGYVIVDLKDSENPIIYGIYANTSFSFRCYNISIQEQEDTQKLEVTIIGTLQ